MYVITNLFSRSMIKPFNAFRPAFLFSVIVGSSSCGAVQSIVGEDPGFRCLIFFIRSIWSCLCLSLIMFWMKLLLTHPDARARSIVWINFGEWKLDQMNYCICSQRNETVFNCKVTVTVMLTLTYEFTVTLADHWITQLEWVILKAAICFLINTGEYWLHRHWYRFFFMCMW